MRMLLGTVQEALKGFGKHDAMLYAAAVAFYTSLSLSPLLALSLWITSRAGPSAQDAVVEQLIELAGEQAGATIHDVIEETEASGGSDFGGVLGMLTLLVGATGVFAQLQKVMNRIWDVRVVQSGHVWLWIRKRLLSLGMIAVVGFLLLVSLVASAVVSSLGAHARGTLPGGEGLWWLLNTLVSLGVFVLLFAAVFRFLPDVRIAWRDVWFGACVTAALFATGKALIGSYLGRSAVGSAYGAAGSLVVALVWIYYSGALVFFGAELTRAWARRHGRAIVPAEHARRLERRAGAVATD